LKKFYEIFLTELKESLKVLSINTKFIVSWINLFLFEKYDFEPAFVPKQNAEDAEESDDEEEMDG